MSRGGARPGGGRKPGNVNVRTREIAERAVAEGITPLEYMIDLMRKPYPEGATAAVKASYDAMRFEAAKACAPFMHARMSSIDQPVRVPGVQGGPAEQGRAVIDAMAGGQLTPTQAATVMQALATLAGVIEKDELEKRIAALEQKQGQERR